MAGGRMPKRRRHAYRMPSEVASLSSEEAQSFIASCLADEASFHWLQDRLMQTGDVDRVGFDFRNPVGSYSQLFNRLANPAGKEAPQMERALLDLRRKVWVLPGLASRHKRWKLLCLAVSTDWLDPHLEEAFPRLGEALSLVEEIVGPRTNRCTHVQLVTFTEWNGAIRRCMPPIVTAFGGWAKRVGNPGCAWKSSHGTPTVMVGARRSTRTAPPCSTADTSPATGAATAGARGRENGPLKSPDRPSTSRCSYRSTVVWKKGGWSEEEEGAP